MVEGPQVFKRRPRLDHETPGPRPPQDFKQGEGEVNWREQVAEIKRRLAMGDIHWTAEMVMERRDLDDQDFAAQLSAEMLSRIFAEEKNTK